MSRSKTYIDLQELLVKPLYRIGFLTRFWILTVVGELTITYFGYVAVPLIYFQNNFTVSIFIGLIVGFITGLSVGAASGILQYNLLRQYFIHKWTIAVTINYIVYSVYTIFVLLWYADNANYPIDNNLEGQTIWLWLYDNHLHILLITLTLVQGIMQWLVFSDYLKKVNWWVFFCLVIVCLSGFGYLPIALII